MGVDSDAMEDKHSSIDTPKIDWKSIYTLGEKPRDLDQVQKGGSGNPWDFNHLRAAIDSLKHRNPTKSLFLLGGQPQPYEGNKFYPSLVVIAVTKGSIPPEFVAIQNPQEGYDVIKSFRNFGSLSWECLDGVDGVFFLKSKRTVHTRAQNLTNEYGTLWTQRVERDDRGRVAVNTAMFSYTVADNDLIEEEYEKGVSSFADFCERFDLNPAVHKPLVKEAVAQGFQSKRAHVEERLAILSKAGYSESFLQNDIEVVAKILPQNSALDGVRDQQSTTYFNQYYGSAKEAL